MKHFQGLFLNLLRLLSVSVGSSQTNFLVKVTVLQLERAVEWKDSLVPGEEKELEVPAEAQEKLRELFKKYSTSQQIIFPYFPRIVEQSSCQLLFFSTIKHQHWVFPPVDWELFFRYPGASLRGPPIFYKE